MKIACGTKSRRCELIVALSVLALSCASAQAQPQSHRAVGRPPVGAAPHGPPPSQSIRERWLAMPPAARQNFRRNAERWMQMSPEERNVMRQRENLRRETIKRETEAAVRDSGLRLSPQDRAQFESRYIQERQKELPALIQQLKKEFQIDQPAKSPAMKPPGSPNSKK